MHRGYHHFGAFVALGWSGIAGVFIGEGQGPQSHSIFKGGCAQSPSSRLHSLNLLWSAELLKFKPAAKRVLALESKPFHPSGLLNKFRLQRTLGTKMPEEFASSRNPGERWRAKHPNCVAAFGLQSTSILTSCLEILCKAADFLTLSGP